MDQPQDQDEEFYEIYSSSENEFYFQGRTSGRQIWAEYPDPPPIDEDLLILYGARPDTAEWQYWQPHGGPPGWVQNQQAQDAGLEDTQEFINFPEIPRSRTQSPAPSICGGSIPDVPDHVGRFMASLTPQGGRAEALPPTGPAEPRRKKRGLGRWLLGGAIAGILLKVGSRLLK